MQYPKNLDLIAIHAIYGHVTRTRDDQNTAVVGLAAARRKWMTLEPRNHRQYSLGEPLGRRGVARCYMTEDTVEVS